LPNTGGAVAAFVSQYSGTTGVGVGVAGFLSDPNVQGAGVAGVVGSPNAVGGYFESDANPGAILVAASGTGNGNANDIFTVIGHGSTGKVGIGTSDSLATLTVKGAPIGVPLTGTVTVTNGSAIVNGTGTKFGSEVAIGDRILSPFEIKVVAGINSDTQLFTTAAWNTPASGTFNYTRAIFRIDDAGNNTKLVMDGLGELGLFTLSPATSLDVNGKSLFRDRLIVANASFGNAQKPSLLTVRAATFGSIPGTVSVASSSALVTGSSTAFLNNIGLGDKVTVSGETHTVVAITDNTHLTVDVPFTITGSGLTLTPTAGLFRTDDTSGTPQFLVNDTGNVGIGSGAALVPTDRLQVFGNIRVGTSGTNGCIKAFDGSMIGGTCSSDERLKTNIEPFEPLMSKLMQLRPVSYDWKADEHPEYHFGNERTSGLIAQQVEKVFPDMVATDERGYKAVNYSKLPLMLLQAVKELKEESDHRESELMETVKQQQAQIQQLLSVVKEFQSRLDRDK
jgi:hypothetical protein